MADCCYFDLVMIAIECVSRNCMSMPAFLFFPLVTKDKNDYLIKNVFHNRFYGWTTMELFSVSMAGTYGDWGSSGSNFLCGKWLCTDTACIHDLVSSCCCQSIVIAHDCRICAIQYGLLRLPTGHWRYIQSIQVVPNHCLCTNCVWYHGLHVLGYGGLEFGHDLCPQGIQIHQDWNTVLFYCAGIWCHCVCSAILRWHNKGPQRQARRSVVLVSILTVIAWCLCNPTSVIIYRYHYYFNGRITNIFNWVSL